MGRLRATLRELYDGDGERAQRFRYGLLAFDLATIAYVIATSFTDHGPVVGTIDLVVGLSHYQAARDGAQHLLDRGYRAPAFLGAQMDPRSQRRLTGFRDCLIAAGLGGDDPVVTTPEPSSVSLGCRLFADLIATLERDQSLKPTRRRDMISGLRRVAKAIGRAPFARGRAQAEEPR